MRTEYLQEKKRLKRLNIHNLRTKLLNLDIDGDYAKYYLHSKAKLIVNNSIKIHHNRQLIMLYEPANSQ